MICFLDFDLPNCHTQSIFHLTFRNWPQVDLGVGYLPVHLVSNFSNISFYLHLFTRITIISYCMTNCDVAFRVQAVEQFYPKQIMCDLNVWNDGDHHFFFLRDWDIVWRFNNCWKQISNLRVFNCGNLAPDCHDTDKSLFLPLIIFQKWVNLVPNVPSTLVSIPCMLIRIIQFNLISHH